MTNGAVKVITSVQRRRRWPRADKERIVAAALARSTFHNGAYAAFVSSPLPGSSGA